MLRHPPKQDDQGSLGKDGVKRELIEMCHEWVCSRCGCRFYNPGFVLDGLTISEIMRRLKTNREQAFTRHVCLVH
jgi:hypothetical protein